MTRYRIPHATHLEPGEILITPITELGWTLLFPNAGGLVMVDAYLTLTGDFPSAERQAD